MFLELFLIRIRNLPLKRKARADQPEVTSREDVDRSQCKQWLKHEDEFLSDDSDLEPIFSQIQRFK